MVKGLVTLGSEGGVSPTLWNMVQVQGPQEFFTLSQVVCEIWCMSPSSPLTNRFNTPLKSEWPI